MKAENQDCFGIGADGTLVVADGVGSGEKSKLAALVVQQCVLMTGVEATEANAQDLINRIAFILKERSSEMSLTTETVQTAMAGGISTIVDMANTVIHTIFGDTAMTCFSAVKVAESNGELMLQGAYCGDVKVVVYNREGEVKFETEDGLKDFRLALSKLLQTLKDNETQRPLIERKIRVLIQSFFKNRNKLDCAVGQDLKFQSEPISCPVVEGDRVVVATDGLWDNYTPEEVIHIILGKPASESLTHLWKATALAQKCQATYLNENDFAPGDKQPPIECRQAYTVYNKLLGVNQVHRPYLQEEGTLQQCRIDNRAIVIFDVQTDRQTLS
ncbi:MAG: protein phosphatase 2C domain-containing protein [Candidatus Margulisiibacteriota bacterium]